jgi:hypothetical protein
MAECVPQDNAVFENLVHWSYQLIFDRPVDRGPQGSGF